MKKKTQDSYGKINKPSLQNLHINQAKMEWNTAFQKTWKSTRNCMDCQTFVQASMYIVYFFNKFGVFEWLYLNH